MYDVSDIVNLQNAVNPTEEGDYTNKLCNLIHIPSPESWYLTAQQLSGLIEKKKKNIIFLNFWSVILMLYVW